MSDDEGGARVYFKTLTGKWLDMPWRKSLTAREMRAHVAAATGIDEEAIRLVWGGFTLELDHVFGVGENHVVFIVLRLGQLGGGVPENLRDGPLPDTAILIEGARCEEALPRG